MLEFKFVLGMLIMTIGFAIMIPTKNVVQDETNVVQNKTYIKGSRTAGVTIKQHTPEEYAQLMVSEAEYEAFFDV